MFRKITAAMFASLLATSAMAASDDFGTAGGNAPTGFDSGEDRAVFVNESGDMHDSATVRSNFMELNDSRQAEIRVQCDDYRAAVEAGSSDLTETESEPTDPVPGVFSMNAACDLVDTM